MKIASLHLADRRCASGKDHRREEPSCPAHCLAPFESPERTLQRALDASFVACELGQFIVLRNEAEKDGLDLLCFGRRAIAPGFARFAEQTRLDPVDAPQPSGAQRHPLSQMQLNGAFGLQRRHQLGLKRLEVVD